MDDRELRSWKEIAEYLGISVRAAQAWERERNLPIVRIPGGRGRVFTTTVEIEQWKRSCSSETAAELPDRSLKRLPRRLLQLAAAVLLIPLSIFVVTRLWSACLNPASHRVEQNALVVLDGHGKEIWRHAFSTPLETAVYGAGPLFGKYVWILDLDGDRRNEVIFAQVPGDTFRREHSVWCFSPSGKILWRFIPGRPVRTFEQEFAPPFKVIEVAVGQLGSDQRPRIVVTSTHVPWWPTQVAVLSAAGKVEREYWHSGAFFRLEIGDLNRDGRNEIYLGGISNGSHTATLVALDPDVMGGASVEEDARFQLLDFAPGREQGRILFPRSCTSFKEQYTSVRAMSLQEDHLLVEVWEKPFGPEAPSLFYTLSPGLQLRSVLLSDRFRTVHSELEGAGLIKHPPGVSEEDLMRGGIRRVNRGSAPAPVVQIDRGSGSVPEYKKK